MSSAPSFGGLQRLLNNAAFQKFKFKGSTSGTATVQAAAVAGTPTITLPAATGTLATLTGTETLTNKTLTGTIYSSIVRCSTQFDAVTGTTGTTLTNVVGMVHTVVPGTYKFEINIPCVATSNTGIKFGFKLTTATLTSTEYEACGFTASGVAVSRGTTGTDQALMFDSAAGAVIFTRITGCMVVGTGGTIQLQAAQHTAHGDTVSVFVGATMQFTRIS